MQMVEIQSSQSQQVAEPRPVKKGTVCPLAEIKSPEPFQISDTVWDLVHTAVVVLIIAVLCLVFVFFGMRVM